MALPPMPTRPRYGRPAPVAVAPVPPAAPAPEAVAPEPVPQAAPPPPRARFGRPAVPPVVAPVAPVVVMVTEPVAEPVAEVVAAPPPAPAHRAPRRGFMPRTPAPAVEPVPVVEVFAEVEPEPVVATPESVAQVDPEPRRTRRFGPPPGYRPPRVLTADEEAALPWPGEVGPKGHVSDAWIPF